MPSSIDQGCYFHPTRFKITIFEDRQREQLHPGHTSDEYFCVGFLSFLLQNIEGGIKSLMLGRLAIEFQFLNPDMISGDIKVFYFIAEMFESHQEAMKFNKRTIAEP